MYVLLSLINYSIIKIWSILWTNWKWQVEEYRDLSARKSELERTDLQKEKTGVFSGSYAKNPATGEIIPIWVADYVLGRFVNICSLCILMLSCALSLFCSSCFRKIKCYKLYTSLLENLGFYIYLVNTLCFLL